MYAFIFLVHIKIINLFISLFLLEISGKSSISRLSRCFSKCIYNCLQYLWHVNYLYITSHVWKGDHFICKEWALLYKKYCVYFRWQHWQNKSNMCAKASLNMKDIACKTRRICIYMNVDMVCNLILRSLYDRYSIWPMKCCSNFERQNGLTKFKWM